LEDLRNEFDVIVENYERTSERFSLEESYDRAVYIDALFALLYRYVQPKSSASYPSAGINRNLAEDVLNANFAIETSIQVEIKNKIFLHVCKSYDRCDTSFRNTIRILEIVGKLEDYERGYGAISYNSTKFCSRGYVHFPPGRHYKVILSDEFRVWERCIRTMETLQISSGNLGIKTYRSVTSITKPWPLGAEDIYEVVRLTVLSGHSLKIGPAIGTGRTNKFEQYTQIFSKFARRNCMGIPDEIETRGVNLPPPLTYPAKFREEAARETGHSGEHPDPAKVESILDMPAPTDTKGLKRFLGMVNYLAKFLPLLSDMTEPLRRLEGSSCNEDWTPDLLSLSLFNTDPD
ncbi:Hypothetical predicted protein, partial [Paramuricea clavata]